MPPGLPGLRTYEFVYFRGVQIGTWDLWDFWAVVYDN